MADKSNQMEFLGLSEDSSFKKQFFATKSLCGSVSW
jgi:hypothetical protein